MRDFLSFLSDNSKKFIGFYLFWKLGFELWMIFGFLGVAETSVTG